MDVQERDRTAAAIIALRPDWASNGIDRLKAMRTWLTANLMDWAYRDALLALVLVAVDPTSDGPARVLTDGPWRAILRHVTGATTDQPPRTPDAGAECATCGVRRYRHAGLSIRIGLDGQPIDEHDWTPAAEMTPADQTTISRAREVAFAHRQEQQA